MPQYDKRGNNVSLTLFESELAKIILDERSSMEPVFSKINRGIAKLIDLNSTDKNFDRAIYGCFTRVAKDFSGYNSMELFLEKDYDLLAAGLLHKIFFEDYLRMAQNRPVLVGRSKFEENFLSQVSTSKDRSKFLSLLRPDNVFLEKVRGREEFKQPEETNKFGIVTKKYTPEHFKQYFTPGFESAQYKYKRLFDSSISKKMDDLEMPFIAGPSGTVGYCLHGMLQVDTFSAEELQRYFIGMAAQMVARGHHSFYEIFNALSYAGFKFAESTTPYNMYRQFLTNDILDSAKFIQLAERYDAALVMLDSEYKSDCSVKLK